MSYYSAKHRNKPEHPTRTWIIWAHDKKDTDFTSQSYKKAWTINSLEKFWIFFNNMKEFRTHQLYFMRDNIPPKFECPENQYGGCLSYKIVHHHDVWQTFCDVTLLALCNKMVNIEHCDEITGITLNPKHQGAILKIWFRNFDWLIDNVIKVKVRHIRGLTSQMLSKHSTNAIPQSVV